MPTPKQLFTDQTFLSQSPEVQRQVMVDLYPDDMQGLDDSGVDEVIGNFTQLYASKDQPIQAPQTPAQNPIQQPVIPQQIQQPQLDTTSQMPLANGDIFQQPIEGQVAQNINMNNLQDVSPELVNNYMQSDLQLQDSLSNRNNVNILGSPENFKNAMGASFHQLRQLPVIGSQIGSQMIGNMPLMGGLSADQLIQGANKLTGQQIPKVSQIGDQASQEMANRIAQASGFNSPEEYANFLEQMRGQSFLGALTGDVADMFVPTTGLANAGARVLPQVIKGGKAVMDNAGYAMAKQVPAVMRKALKQPIMNDDMSIALAKQMMVKERPARHLAVVRNAPSDMRVKDIERPRTAKKAEVNYDKFQQRAAARNDEIQAQIQEKMIADKLYGGMRKAKKPVKLEGERLVKTPYELNAKKDIVIEKGGLSGVPAKKTPRYVKQNKPEVKKSELEKLKADILKRSPKNKPAPKSASDALKQELETYPNILNKAKVVDDKITNRENIKKLTAVKAEETIRENKLLDALGEVLTKLTKKKYTNQGVRGWLRLNKNSDSILKQFEKSKSQDTNVYERIAVEQDGKVIPRDKDLLEMLGNVSVEELKEKNVLKILPKLMKALEDEKYLYKNFNARLNKNIPNNDNVMDMVANEIEQSSGISKLLAKNNVTVKELDNAYTKGLKDLSELKKDKTLTSEEVKQASATFDETYEKIYNKITRSKSKGQMGGKSDPSRFDYLKKPKQWYTDTLKALYGEASEATVYAKDLNRDRVGKIASLSFKVWRAQQPTKRAIKAFAKANKLDLEEVRQILPFLRERTIHPASMAKTDAGKLFAKLTTAQKNELTEMADDMYKPIEKLWAIYKKLYDITSEDIVNHVSHLWHQPKAGKNFGIGLSNSFATKSKFAKKRTVFSYLEGIEERKLKPKTLDYYQILEIEADSLITAIQNKRLVNKLLKNSEFTDPKTGVNHLLSSTKQLEPDWVRVDHSAFKGWVNPDIAKPIKIILDNPSVSNIVGKSYDMINAVLKRMMLQYSFFHHYALFETSVGINGLKKSATLFDPREIYKGMTIEGYILNKNPEITADALRNNLNLGALSDVQRSKFDKMMKGLVEKTGGKISPLKPVDKINEWSDRLLWDYLHNGIKLMSYETLLERHLLDPKFAELTPKQIKREIAQVVNDTSGGQYFELMGFDKNTQKWMQRLVLSPDWTISTIRQALSPTGIGTVERNSLASALRAKQGRAFWTRAAIYFGLSTQAMNAAARKLDEKVNPEYYKHKKMGIADYTTFGNVKGKTMRVFVGRNKDGSEKYIKMGKQFTEVFDWVWDPEGGNINPLEAVPKRFSAKAAPALQSIAIWMSDGTLGGFNPEEIRKASGYAKTYEKIMYTMKSLLPLTLKDKGTDWGLSDLAFPSSKGLSPYKATSLFKKALVRGDTKYITELTKDCYENHLDGLALLKTANTSLKAEGTKEIKKIIKAGVPKDKLNDPDFIKQLQKLDKKEADYQNNFKNLDSILTRIASQELKIKTEGRIDLKKKRRKRVGYHL